MKVSSTACFLLFSSAYGFMPASQRKFASRVQMSEDTQTPVKTPPKSSALVPIKEETVEFAAGLVTGAAGFIIGGPVLGAIAAAAGNYVSKGEGDVGVVVKSVAKTSIEVFNYLANLDQKYDVLGKAQKSLSGALDKLKSNPSVDPETISKVEKALASTKSKISEINEEYDLVGGSMTALGVIGDLVEKAVKKLGELNSEYSLSEKAMASLKGAVEKAKEAADKASMK